MSSFLRWFIGVYRGPEIEPPRMPEGPSCKTHDFRRTVLRRYTRINDTLRSMLAVHAAYKSAEAGRLRKAVDVAVQGKSREEKYACLNKIGVLLLDMGKLEDAEPLLRRALEGREATLGKSHPDTLTSINNLGTLLQAMGKLEDAEALLLRGKE